jgi:hypothetical protein
VPILYRRYRLVVTGYSLTQAVERAGFALERHGTTSMDNMPQWILLGVIVLGAAFVYFIPTIVAASRSHHNTAAILILNLFLGWSFIGWVIALVWSATAVEPREMTVAYRPKVVASERLKWTHEDTKGCIEVTLKMLLFVGAMFLIAYFVVKYQAAHR